MELSIWMAMLIAATGTYLTRALPLLWMQRTLSADQDHSTPETLPGWLSSLGPLMIASMLGVSLVPANPSTLSWVATALGISATVVAWRLTRSLGVPVIVGVSAFALAMWLSRIIG